MDRILSVGHGVSEGGEIKVADEKILKMFNERLKERFKKEIQEAVEKAIKEDWFNLMTTSDLQGVCDVEAWNIYHKANPEIKFADCFWERSAIQDKILEEIYERVNPF